MEKNRLKKIERAIKPAQDQLACLRDDHDPIIYKTIELFFEETLDAIKNDDCEKLKILDDLKENVVFGESRKASQDIESLMRELARNTSRYGKCQPPSDRIYAICTDTINYHDTPEGRKTCRVASGLIKSK